MIVTLIFENELNPITLPEKIEGQYWLETKTRKKIISIEAEDGKWHLKSNRKARILDKDENLLKSIELETNNIHLVKIEDSIGVIFIEKFSDNNQIFEKLVIKDDINISIGRGEENIICFKSELVSKIHANLIYHNKYWSLKDNNSTNKVFVNNKMVKSKELNFGDVIYIMGLKIIVGYDFIAINHPENLVTIKPNIFIKEVQKPKLEDDEWDDDFEDDFEEEIEKSKEYFYRSPRFKNDIELANIKVDNPVEKTEDGKMPLVFTIGPSLTMGAISLVGIAINPIITIGSLVGTVAWPVISKQYEKHSIKKKESIRQNKYSSYLKELENRIETEKERQKQILKENFVNIDELEDRILNKKRELWERTLWEKDFLTLRLGIGNLPLAINLQYNERRFSVKEDNLMEEMYALCERPNIIENVPITISLYEDYISGVIGNEKEIKEFAKGFIIELASLYSYDEVKMIFLYNETDKNEFNFVKWLPHTFSDDKKFRFVATNTDEVKEISYYLSEEIESRIEKVNNNRKETLPYYVVFVLDKDLSLKSEMLNQIYSKNQNLNFSVVNFFNKIEDLPKECTKVIEFYKNKAKIYDKNEITDNYIVFKPDIYPTSSPDRLSKKLANTFLNTLKDEYKLPKMISFLQMFKVGKIEHLNIINRWKENNPIKTLETPIGVDKYGELFKLDLHQRAHGPHGLVAGMTGSGKSEFIITYILSLAVNYHPEEVAFILIDYKGGGMAKAFEKLPHVVGIITNLDGASINRALVSINSELKRRQALFEEASQKIGISNIDIYKYQKLYREHQVEEPLPHLFIISDEFAELKSQQPEFMTELISTARIGRSLGVHLILATQKPNGVVDDQIWSNSKFRVCLKVQEKADSIDMIKKPDAAMITDTGRFYLQVGYNEIFEMGQSAWAGETYHPSDKYIKEKDDSIVFIDNNARVIKEVKLNKKQTKSKNPQKQLDAIVDYIEKLTMEENIKLKPIWLPPMNEIILLEQLEQKYKTHAEKFVINPLVGEYDDPANQRQNSLHVPITKKGNLIIYGSQGSGKTMLLNTAIYSILKEHSPEEVNIYLLDFEAETLKAFEKAPQIGDVILSYDNEKIDNLIRTIYKELENRKKKFSDFGGTYQNFIEESQEKLPNIIIIISNYMAFSELYPDKEDEMNYLTREGAKYGIYFIITAISPNAVKYKMTQNFPQMLVLQFNDETNYSGLLGKTEGLVPSAYEGRGLVKIEKQVHEFQTASLVDDENTLKFIREKSKELSEKYTTSQANKIAILPKVITTSVLTPYIIDELSIPIGMEKKSLKIQYFNIGKHYINVALAEDTCPKQFLKDLANFMVAEYKKIEVMVLDEKNEITGLNSKIEHISGKNSIDETIDKIFEMIVYRNNTYKDALEQKTACETFTQKVIFINSLKDILDSRDDMLVEKMELALEKGSKDYNVNFILFDEARKLGYMSSHKWYKAHLKLNDGIWLGRGFNNQYIYNVSNNIGEVRQDITDNNFAISIENGMAKLIKILNTKGDNMDE